MGKVRTGFAKGSRMRRIIDNDVLTMIIRLAIGLTFIYASFYKIIDPGDFAKAIWYYHLIPGETINLLAIILPWVELLSGLALILGVYHRGAILLVMLMALVFIVALTYAIAAGIDIDCGCFKTSGDSGRSAWNALVMDVGIVLLTAQLVFTRSRRWMLAGAN